MGQFGIGQSVRRVEDARLLTGAGLYLDDITLPGQTFAVFLRSPHAHARIRRLGTHAAAAMPGVLGVLTGADLAADGVGHLPCRAPIRNKDGSRMAAPTRPAMPADRVRFMGDIVAMVVADTPDRARDAAERIAIEYEPLESVTDTAGALAPGAPRIWERAKDNLCFDWETGDAAAVAAALTKAARIVRRDLINNRLCPSPLEPRGAIADFDPAARRFTLYASSQGVHQLQRTLADMFGLKKGNLRVITPDVGGGFGMKIFPYPEYALALWAARRLGRPVKWTGDRTEAFLSDTHGRDHVSQAELALDADGHFLALKVSTIANLGAYLSLFSPYIAAMAGAAMLVGLYTTPAIHLRVRGVFTNTAPVDAYRGAGRPEANYLLERMVDAASRETGLAPDELRRRNFIPASALPYETPLGETYDSGDFDGTMRAAMARADWAGFPARRAAARARGGLLGRGMATYIETCGGGPEEAAEIRLDDQGGATLFIGSQDNGQGHRTAYAQLAADRLGLPVTSIAVVQGDTDRVASGHGTGGSRALAVGGVAVVRASETLIASTRGAAARLLDAREAEIDFAEGLFRVRGANRSLSLGELARAIVAAGSAPPSGAAVFDPPASTYPNGCHIAEVEIDPETGAVALTRYTVVDDFGTVVNPLLVEGQVHGGIAQGIGQALREACVYDPASGRLLTGSFLDYALPRARNLPFISFATNPVPCVTNPLGIKGAGEAGAIGAPPAAINAVIDALAEFGVTHIDMPATPEKIWRALRDRASAA